MPTVLLLIKWKTIVADLRDNSSFLFFFAKNIREVNLIIEQGNTSSKVAVYAGGRIVASFMYRRLDVSDIAALFDKYPFTGGILSTVIDVDDELVSCIRKRIPRFICFDESVNLPIEVKYQTPATLGKDRLAAVVGANYLYPDRNILVIDAGTAITYEVVEANGIYLGGNISPGMSTRFKALNNFTKRLPLVSEKEEQPFIGVSTESAIQAGVVNGIVFEMDGYIDCLRSKYSDLLVFLTGGHSFYFERRLKNSIFADINLVLTGLNRILEYNVED